MEVEEGGGRGKVLLSRGRAPIVPVALRRRVR